MFLKNCRLVEAVCLLSLLVLILVQIGCESSKNVFKKELAELFEDDKDMRNTLTEYLETVPTSHKSRSAAMRIMIGCDCQSEKDLKKNIRKHKKIGRVKGRKQFHLMAVLGRIFENAPDDSCDDEECSPCPTVSYKCVPCQKECNKCPPCPVPDYCPMPKPDENCPPKPECPVCENGTVAGLSRSAFDSNFSKSFFKKQQNEFKRRAKHEEERLRNRIHHNSFGSAKFEQHSQNHHSHTSHHHNKTTATIITRGSNAKEVPVLESEYDDKDEPDIFSFKEEPVHHQSSSSQSSEKSSQSASDTNGSKTYNFNNSSTTIKNVIVDPNGSKSVTVTTTTTTVASLQGTYLFEKNLNLLVSNETIREQINKMIDEIPNSTGGREMELAEKLMMRFGERKIEPIRRKGSSRIFTYLKARGSARCIIGHLLERFRRKKCECGLCKPAKICKCKKPKNCKENQKCHACPPAQAPCPVPTGCKTYPACKLCTKDTIEDPEYDGKPGELDDLDTEDPIKEGELLKEQTPEGFAREFKDVCGNATLNPLTPATSVGGYMNGGEDEVYGEWPSFARLEIRMPELDYRSGLCGGVLISNRHVLTAGHCVQTTIDNATIQIAPESFNVLLGDHRKKVKDEFEESFSVSSVCRSSKFNDPHGEGSRYDYGILTLSRNVTFNDYKQPACLPYKPTNMNKTSHCYVVGLGMTKFGSNKNHTNPTIVQKMRLVRTSCKDWGIRHDDRSRHCFTKNGSKGDTCGGDSGGPILCLSDSKHWTVVGLVSYGSEACDGSESNGWVAVYTRIQSILHQMNLDCQV